ncbi:MAG: UDP-N-acetylmuramate dehydrogenase [Candidatus Muirbacterium halophilum]|nr:UDP-N-acetylmuramate dehydrogenase [Candidatus Muirbacterium halophilum]MCK9475428.1 UDP-N-acetylmuramate dehydrogenase [Candidatus Muirbacterium halophilum]
MKKVNISLKKYTKIKTGGQALFFCPENLDDIKNIPKNIKVIGNGSNILCEDKDYSFLNLNLLNSIFLKDNILTVYSGVKCSTLLRFLLNNNLSGLEFLSGIPGNTGGIVCMNAGSYGEEIGNYIKKVIYFDVKNWQIKECENNGDLFKYRKSVFNSDKIVLYVVFKELEKAENQNIKNKINDNFKRKLKTQPVLKHTFGSVFKNPVNISAWKLLSNSKIQGKCKGDACFSRKHANFIENKGNALFTDIKYLIEKAKEKVYNDTEIKLEEEVIYM